MLMQSGVKHRERILIAEADDRLYMALRSALEGAGYSVVSGYLGEIALLPVARLDGAIVDSCRSEARSSLMSALAGNKIPTLLISSDEEASWLGSTGVLRLPKPFTEKELLSHLRAVMCSAAAA